MSIVAVERAQVVEAPWSYGRPIKRIYLAARYSRHAELLVYANDLKLLGYEVTSRWIQGNYQIADEHMEDAQHDDIRRRFAEEDLDDLIRADMCLSFTEVARAHTSRGGRHVEFGIAYAKDMASWVVGHRENVFHCLDRVRFFLSWDECLAALELRARVP